MPFLAILLFVFSSCSWFGSSEEKEVSPGWRSAGLEFPDADGIRNGAHKLIGDEDHLFLIESSSPPYEVYIRDRSLERSWRGHHLNLNSLKWDTLVLPEQQYVNELYLEGGELYVGTNFTGNLLKTNVNEISKWENIDFPRPREEYSGPEAVFEIARFADGFFIGYHSLDSNLHKLQFTHDFESYQSIRGIGEVEDSGLMPDEVLQVGEWLYGISFFWGNYRWKPGMDSWEKLPSAREKEIEEDYELSQGMIEHNGKLHVSYEWIGKVYRWEEDTETWTDLTPRHSVHDWMGVPQHIKGLTSYKGDLFIWGMRSAVPYVWRPKDPDCPDFGDWQKLSTFSDETMRVGDVINGMVGARDWLYVSWHQYVAKMPYSDVDKIAKLPYVDSVYASHVSNCPKAN